MKYTVKSPFIDKYTEAFNDVGAVIDITETRAAEIESAGIQLERIDAPAVKTRAKKKKE